MRDLIHAIAQQAIDASKPMQLVEAEVLSAPPDLKIKVSGNDKLIIPKELIVVSEHLCNYKRKVTVKNQGNTKLHSSNVEDLYPKVPIQNSHDFAYIKLNSGDFEMVEGEIEFLDELKAGDKVMCAVMQGGQLFYIFDRIRTYE
jgi:hypothetical protein